MKIADIINQLRAVLPKYTNYLSEVLTIDSITVIDGNALIVTTAAHGLPDGANITLKDVEVGTAIDSVSQDGLIFTFTTATDHDLTYGWPEHEYVDLQGFTDADWNDSFYLTGVPNRRTFKVRSTNSLPTLNGNETLQEIRSDGINGRYSAAVPGVYQSTFPLQFPIVFYDPTVAPQTIFISDDFTDGTYSGGTISGGHRISGAVTDVRALDQYTEQGLSDLWMFVIPGDATVSKDRSTMSDATSTKSTGVDMRLRLIDNFSLLVVKNTTTDIAGLTALDICRHDLLLPILKALNGTRFATGLSYGTDFKTVFTGHAVADYNEAFLVYKYDFEVVSDLTNDDTVQPEDTRAFRDVDYTLEIGGDDTDTMTILPIDLDEVEL